MKARKQSGSRATAALLFILIAIALDQASKLAIDHYAPLQEAIAVIPFLSIYRTYNTGVAFSMLSDTSGYFIVGLRLVVVAFVLWLWRRTPSGRPFAHLGFSLVIAGALGNLIDRFAYGHVIDFILFHTQTWSFAVFNLADSYITLGAICIALDELFFANRKNS